MQQTRRALCPLCKSTKIKEGVSLSFSDERMLQFLRQYYDGRIDEDRVKDMSYCIDKCESCGGIFQREILNEEGMAQLYSKWISSSESQKKVYDKHRQMQLAKHIGRIISLFPKPDSVHLLDYGMGWGDWCHMAQSFGLQVHGVEIDEKRIEFARARGIEAYTPDDLPEKKYDFVYMEQVLEHVPTPYETMEKVSNLAQEGSYIHIGVPNGKRVAQSMQTPEALLAKGPAHPLEHINIFTRSSLIAFMEQFGFAPVAQKEALIRCTSLPLFLKDSVLALARLLPASVFPPGTSLLFQKKNI